jgi:hypothetical protein
VQTIASNIFLSRDLALSMVLIAALIAGDANAQAAVQRFVTQGRAKTVVDNLYECPVKVGNHRVSAVGQIAASDGSVLTVPAETVFQSQSRFKGADLFNECNKVTPQIPSEVTTANIPIVEVDAEGEVISGYIIGDNYFELYVNGQLVAVDPIPFTPFNAVIVKFKAKRPITYAFKLVDWEEHLGLGMERSGGNAWHPGDGGLIARFSDGTVTDSSWRAQAFYIAPLNTPDEVVERGNVHDTTALGRVHPHARKPTCQERCYAVHYGIPAHWAKPGFDDSRWPRAYEYTDEDVGVTNRPAYARYAELFDRARWIWTVNLALDNLVIVRKTGH